MLNKTKDELLKNPHFCVVPWTHTYLSPQSERRLCCASREKSSFVNQYIDREKADSKEYNPVSLKQHWNSEYMKNIRKKMLSGEKLSECEVCDEQILSLSTYRHWFTKELFSNRLSSIIEMTNPDGFTELEAISFDYRFNNACNFKCRTCGDQFSSSWEIENQMAGDYKTYCEPWFEPANKEKIKHFQNTVVENEFAEAVRAKTIRELYWVGGEPLVWKQHWQYMEEIIDLNYANEVYARYNTNLSQIERNGKNLFTDLLPHFKAYMISASIDGAGEIGEFIRTGLNWKKWLKNFEEGLRASVGRADNSMLFDVTLSLPSLFCLDELLDEALRLNVRTEVKVMYGFDPFVVLHPLAVPQKVLHPLLDRLIKKYEKKITDKQMPLLNTLKDLKNRKTFDLQFSENYSAEFKRGKEYLQKISARRPEFTTSFEKIYSQDPAVLDWWSQI
jgi:hypothetical protein